MIYNGSYVLLGGGGGGGGVEGDGGGWVGGNSLIKQTGICFANFQLNPLMRPIFAWLKLFLTP